MDFAAAAVVAGLVEGTDAWRPRLEEAAESWALADRTQRMAAMDMEAVHPGVMRVSTCFRTLELELEASSAAALLGILGSLCAYQRHMLPWQLVAPAAPEQPVLVASTEPLLVAVVARRVRVISRSP